MVCGQRCENSWLSKRARTVLDFFVTGMMVASFAAAGLYFLRFWRETRDALFLSFAAAFWLLALNRVGLALVGELSEPGAFVFLVRLLAYILIVVAIVSKNRRRGSPVSSGPLARPRLRVDARSERRPRPGFQECTSWEPVPREAA